MEGNASEGSAGRAAQPPAQWHTTADPVTDREFWQRVLAEGSYTPVPRWSGEHSAPGAVAEHRTALPAATAQAVRRLADDLATDPGTVLLAACARVLAALTSDSAVVVGYLGADGPAPQALPCPVPVADGPWRALLHTAARAAAAVTGRPAAALAELRAEADGAPALFDTLVVAGRAPRADDLAPETVLAVGLDTTGQQPELVLGHRPRALDAGQAGRISGYLLAALDTLARRPEADHHEWSPVSAAETAHQLDGLAAPGASCPTAGSISSSRNRSGCAHRTSPPNRANAPGPTASSTPAPTASPTPCATAACATKTPSRWSASATWNGSRPCSAS